MKHMSRILNISVLVLFLSLAVVGMAYAQEPGVEVPAPFVSILAGALAIERLLQLIRNILSPVPEEGPLAQGSLALRYYTTIGGVILGLLIAFASGYRLLEAAGITLAPVIDTALTGVAMGLGSEFVHEVIRVIGEGKRALQEKAGDSDQLKRKRALRNLAGPVK